MSKEIYPIFISPEKMRDQTDSALIHGLEGQFPIENKNFILDVSNVHAERKTFSDEDEKTAILKFQSLTYPIKGDLRLIRKETGRVVDKLPDFPLMDAFYVTGKHTLVYKGNNYAVSNQLLLHPGVYTRTNNIGELVSHVNTGKGQSFYIRLDPREEIFYLEISSSNSLIAPILMDLFNVQEDIITQYIPRSIWLKNKAVAENKHETTISKMYFRMVSTKLQDKSASFPAMCAALRDAFQNSTLNEKATEATLGKAFSNVTAEVILRTLKNLVLVHTGEREEDNRDSLQFKRVQNLPDYLEHRLAPAVTGKSADSTKKVVSKLSFNLEKISLEQPRIKDAIPVKPFNKVYTDFILKSELVSTPSETNPLERMELVGKVTVLGKGEGGISEDRAVPLAAKNIDPSHLGLIDPSRTPESSHAGIDQRFTVSAHRDKEGTLYTQVLNRRGEKEFISANQIMTSVIGFPHQEGKDLVQAQSHGQLQTVKRSQVDYWLIAGSDLFTITTNLVPFLNVDHPGRLTMAGKALPQALSLEQREQPLVQTVNRQGTSFAEVIGRVVSTTAPTDGTVVRVNSKEVIIKDDRGARHMIPLVKNLPFNMKGFHDDEEPKVSVGDKVSHGQILAENNYTRDGVLSLGKNLYAAYMPYKGYNHEDGIVISESAAKGLNSLHAYKVDYDVNPNTISKKVSFKRYFPTMFTPEQLDKLDEEGYAKEGVVLEHGDPVYAVLEKRELTPEDKYLSRLHRVLVSPYRAVVEQWNHDEKGEVVHSQTDSKFIRFLIRSVKPIETGDKLTGLHGNKGIVSLILPDDKMPTSRTTGKPVDIILNPASVTSRVNLGQVLETMAAKIAKKTGKTYFVKNFEAEDNLKKLKTELKENGLSDTDSIYDPVTGKTFGDKILAGPQYILKLYKTTDQNYSARNVGSYDTYMQPTKGGEEGAKAVGYMEMLGLLGSNARKNLKEIATIKSEENTEFWSKFQRGELLPKPKMTFATSKFFDYLKASGVKTSIRDGKLQASPMTDSDILSMSHGEIDEPTMLNSKNLEPEKGGLFDMTLTGGPKGVKWSHYSLAEPIVNPIFEKPVRTLLGISQEQFMGLTEGSLGVRKNQKGQHELVNTKTGKAVKTYNFQPLTKTAAEEVQEESDFSEGLKVGGEGFKELLRNINVSSEIEKSKKEFHETKSVSKKDKIVKRLKYLAGLRSTGFTDAGSAYILHNIPVLPPISRPYMVQGGNRVEYADVNQLYKEHMLVNSPLKDIKDHLPAGLLTSERRALYEGAKVIMGVNGVPLTANSKGRGIKGLITQVAGSSPKFGLFQAKLLSKKQDVSGRATIYASPKIGFNEAEIPKEMIWTMYKYHILRDLAKNGYSVPEAEKAWKDRNIAATNSFNKLIKQIPMIMNRAPTLMKSNITAVYPVPVDGSSIGINPLHLPGFAGDFDGDALSTYVPVTPEAIQEARDKLLPETQIHDYRKGYGHSLYAPGHEAILGAVHLTEPDMSKEVVEFNTEQEALEALRAGRVEDNTPIIVKRKG